MVSSLRELWAYRDLVKVLVCRDLTIRYKNSVLGFFWSLANPLVQVATITIIFKYVLEIQIPNYSAYVLCAFMPWLFFLMSLADAGESIQKHHDLLKKTYFPREVLPIAAVIANLIHLVLAMCVFFIYLLVLGVAVQAGWLLLPFLLILHFCFNLGLAFFVSAAAAFYDDVRYLAGVATGLFFYFCPVIYLSEQILFSNRIPEHLRGPIWEVYHWNPMATFLELYRQLLLPPFISEDIQDVSVMPHHLVIAIGFTIILAVGGFLYFNAKKWKFAERP